MVVKCLVISRGGLGPVWLFGSVEEARRHPIPQMDDVYATDPATLVSQYGRYDMEPLISIAEGRDRARLADAAERWKTAPTHASLGASDEELVWRLVARVAQKPPLDPGEIVRIISEDRAAREGRILKSRPGPDNWFERKAPELPRANNGDGTMPDKTSRKRFSDEGKITILAKENPKRAGSAAHGRFANYKNGMTVKAAKEAGLTAADLAYDSAHEYIRIDEPVPAE